MSDRKEFVLSKIQELKRQLNGEAPTNQADESLKRDIAAFEEELAQIEANEAAVATAAQEHEERVNQATASFDDAIEQMDFAGLTLAQIVGGTSEYQLVKISFKKYILALADSFSQQIANEQTAFAEYRRAAEEYKRSAEAREDQLQAKCEEQQRQIYQVTLELQDMTNSRDAAARELGEAKQEIERLNGHVDDLRKEIAVGARAAINVVDTEEQERQKKELADKIRRERTIYGKEWVDPIRRNKYRAKLAISDEAIEFPWTEETKFFVIDESEVQQFRSEYGITLPAIETADVAEKDEAGVTPEQFQVRAPEVPAVYVPTEPAVREVVQKSIEERIADLEKAVFGEVKGSAA